MAISVDWSVTPFLITIPQSDLTLDTGTKYNLDVDVFWQLLRDFADSEEGMAQPVIYTRIPATSSTPSITEINDDYYQLQFEDGLYSVNIINGNTNIREVEVKNQVSVNTNNTTGFIDPEFLQLSTFTGKQGVGVHLDPLNASGNAIDETEYPAGIRKVPCLTEDNFETIANENGFRNIYVLSSMTLNNDHSGENHVFIGDSPQNVVITVDAGSDLSDSKFQDCYITGKLGPTGGNIIWECVVGSITNANGFIYQSTIEGPIVVSDNLSIERCWVAPSATNQEFELDFNNLAKTVLISSWNGGRIVVKNMVSGSIMHAHSVGGKVTIDASCTGGTARIYGGFEIVDNGSLDALDNDTIPRLNWAEEVEGTYTAEEVLRVVAAALAGKATGLDTNAPVFRDINDTKDRITATTDATGNRSAVTLVGS